MVRRRSRSGGRDVADSQYAPGWRAYRPANGTEGLSFMEQFCHRCAKDNEPAGLFCQILTDTFCLRSDDPKYPVEWRVQTEKPWRAECTAFEEKKEFPR
jgi:hypothetical protein